MDINPSDIIQETVQLFPDEEVVEYNGVKMSVGEFK